MLRISESFEMNGFVKPKLVLDTNAVIALIDGRNIVPKMRITLDESDVFVSIITRIELYAKPDITPEEIHCINRFLSSVSVIPLSDLIELETVLLRRKYPKRKLPDCIIAATAVVAGAVLLTDDSHLLNLSFTGYYAKPLW